MTPAELKDLLHRYARNEVTEEEKQLVNEWYESYAHPHDLSPADEERLGREIRADIGNKINAPTSRIRTIRIMRYAAAVVAIFISVSVFFRKKTSTHFTTEAKATHFTSIKTKNGEIKKVKLPDGSTLWLNAKSEIRVSDDFDALPERYVYLDEGEAFFEVTKNPQRPFLVNTPHLATRVLGTSFNVKAYSSLKKASVTVMTGKVRVNANKKVLATLTPNMQVNYDVASGAATIHTIDAAMARAWTTGTIVLSNASFNELALALQNTYNIKLSSKNNATLNYQYNLKINTTHTLDETLRIICSVHLNHYRRTNNEVVLY